MRAELRRSSNGGRRLARVFGQLGRGGAQVRGSEGGGGGEGALGARNREEVERRRRIAAGTVAGGGSARLGSSRARGRRRGSGEIRVGHWNVVEALGGGADVGTATRGGSDVEAGGAPTEQGRQSDQFKVFEPILTVQFSKFHIGTQNLVKIKVVEDKMSYNFCFGRKLD